MVLGEVSDLPGAVDQEGSLAFAEHCDGLSVAGGQGVLGEEAAVIQLLEIVESGDPLFGDGVVNELAVGVNGGDFKLSVEGAVIHDGELEPVMRDLNEGAGDRGVARVENGLAVGQELIPCVIRAGNGNAALIKNGLVDEHILPEARGGNCIVLAVGGGSHHAVLHVGRIVGVLGAYLVDGDDLVCGDEGFGVGIGEEEQDVGLGAGLEVGQDFGLPLLVGGAGAVVDLVAGGLFVCRNGGFEVLAVAVVSAVRSHDVESDGVLRRLVCGLIAVRGGLLGLCGCLIAAGAQREHHDNSQKQCYHFFHVVFSS